MKMKVIIHKADEGGFWAEAPAIPGCATKGEIMDELLQNLRDTIEGCLSVDVDSPDPASAAAAQVVEIAV